MLAAGVCLACVPPLPNNSPDRAWPDSAVPLGMPFTLVEWGVMRLLLSSLRRDATRVHIILTNRERRCPVSWTLLVTIPLNHHLGLFSFTCTRGWPIGVGAHHHLTSRLPDLPLRRWCGVLPGLRVRGKLDVLPTSGSTVFYNRSAVFQPARHCPLDGRVH